METICNIRIEGKQCNIEFRVKKSNLYSCSRYFRDIIENNNEQTEFLFSNQDFDETAYKLYFSEFPSENFPEHQINSQTDARNLNELLKN